MYVYVYIHVSLVYPMYIHIHINMIINCHAYIYIYIYSSIPIAAYSILTFFTHNIHFPLCPASTSHASPATPKDVQNAPHGSVEVSMLPHDILISVLGWGLVYRVIKGLVQGKGVP